MMWTRSGAWAATATCIAMLTAGCASNYSVSPTTVTNPSSRAPSTREVDALNEEELLSETPTAVPSWDEAWRSSAREMGERVMRRFARPQMSQTRWWQELRPLLSASAVQAWKGTDPASVPVRRVSGRVRVATAGSAYLAEVEVPTNVGIYVVLLVREGAGEPWRAEDIRPPTRASR